MQTFVALLRGINVGGKNVLPMRDLVGLLEKLGLEGVETYIQSGNLVFRSQKRNTARLSKEISASVADSKGFRPYVLVMDQDEFRAAISNNPFDSSDGKLLHFGFLGALPKAPDMDSLEAVRSKTEKYKLVDRVFYLFAPDGIGRSKLAAKIEKAVGVPVTARNWNTVRKLASMIHPERE